MVEGYFNNRLTDLTLVSRRILGFNFLWEVHTDACTCSYCTGYWDFNKHQQGKGWRGCAFKIILPKSWRHGWKILTFRTNNAYQHYLRVA